MAKRTKQKIITGLKEKAQELYRLGYTTREIGKIVKRSHTWVAWAVKNTLSKTKCN